MKKDTRIYLTPLRDEHIARYMALSDDPELIEAMAWKPFEANEKKRFIHFLHQLSLPYLNGGVSIVFSIISSANDVPIGFVSIKGINTIESRAEVGIAIMEKKYRENGYGTQALRQLIEYAFNVLGLERLGLTVFPGNQRAKRAYGKLGFQQTDVLKKSWPLPDGGRADMLVMELSRDRLS